MKILKHCTTRWLSLQKWPALQSYFTSQIKDVEKTGGRVKRISECLDNPEVKLYFYFLDYILGPLNEFNTLFQSNQCLLGTMKQEMDRLLRKFLAKFMRSEIIRDYNKDLTQIPYTSRDAQLHDDFIAVGMSARTYLKENEENIPIATPTKFFMYVRKFYHAAVAKMQKKFPFGDVVLEDSIILDPKKRNHTTSEADCPPGSTL